MLTIVAIVSAACASNTPSAPQGPVNAQLTLAPGETGVVNGAGIGITFEGVAGDSRCPGDAICIQGGDAIVRIGVIPTTGNRATYDLHTGNTQPAKHQDLTIALEALTPYPFSSRPPISPNDYRATLRVTR